MKAFLSHSSNDKAFVRAVADAIGPINVEIDEHSFEHIPNAQAIKSALKRSALFVYFLSESSLKSPYIKFELESALEARASGEVRDIMIFSIDQTSHRALPEWMREINVNFHAKDPGRCARLIKTRLAEIYLKSNQSEDFYIGREDDEKLLRAIVARPINETPKFLHIAGHFGVGRRTFLGRALKANFPGHFQTALPINVPAFSTIDDLYSELLKYHETCGRNEIVERVERFNSLSDTLKISEVARILQEIIEYREIPLFFDDGGLFNEDGSLAEIFSSLYDALPNTGRPAAAFVQSRILAARFRDRYPLAAHIHLRELSSESIKELISLKLKDLDLQFSGEELEQLCELSDGHPFNINFIVFFAARYGIQSIIVDPSEIVSWKANRGLEFLRKNKFTEVEIDVINVLIDYKYCDISAIAAALDREATEVTKALRDLEDMFCVDRRGRLFLLSPPVRNSVRFDRRFRKDLDWHKATGNRILAEVKKYEGDESINISLVTNAIVPALRENAEIPWVSVFILPSHFIRIARDFYDSKEWEKAVEFANEALKKQKRLTQDGIIEALRIRGLAATRINPYEARIFSDIDSLLEIKNDSAKRVAYFLRGFAFRFQKKLDRAEAEFRKAYELRPEHIHTNRELASILCKTERFDEAEAFARQAYRKAPDNPFIVDVLLDVLEGKKREGSSGLTKEILELEEKLKELDLRAGSHFYLIREADILLQRNKPINTLSICDRILRQDPSFMKARQLKIRALQKKGDIAGARKEKEKLQATASSDIDSDIDAEVLEIEMQFDENDLLGVKRSLENIGRYSSPLEKKYAGRLQRAIAFEGDKAPRELVEWARQRR